MRDRHRRHQGDGQGRARRHRAQHHRASALTRRVVRDCGLRPGDRILVTGTHRRPRPRGDGARATSSRSRATCAPTWRRSTAWCAPRSRPAATRVVAMKDPTRGGARERAARDGGQERRRHRARRGEPCRCRPAVRAAAELLGIDPLHVANEGKAVLGVRARGGGARCSRRCARIRSAATRRSSARCIAEHPGRSILDTGFGRRLLAEPEGEPLPRIC